MKTLIIGFGSIGRRHFRNLLALGETDILFFRSHQSTLSDDELKGFQVETDMHTALSYHPDAVIIANPTALHLEAAIPAAQAGCHILIEKPLSHSMERVEEFREAIHRGGGKVLVGYQFRFHPGLQRIAEWQTMNTQNPIGRPLSFHAHWGEYLPGWHPWEDYHQGYSARADLGGGVVLTLCHPLDYLRWIFGDVDEIWAFTGNSGDLCLPVEEIAEIGLRFINGCIGTIHLDFIQRPLRHTLDIIGTRGQIHWDYASGMVSVLRSDQVKEINNPSHDSTCENSFPQSGFDRNTMFLDEIQHFREIVRGGVEPICTLEDGIQALRIALAAHKSVRDGIIIRL